MEPYVLAKLTTHLILLKVSEAPNKILMFGTHTKAKSIEFL